MMKYIVIFLLCLGCTVSGYSQQANIDSLLRVVYEKDQGVRHKMIRAYKSGMENDSLVTLTKKMVIADAENQRIVFGLLDTEGWPEGLSKKANKAVFLVIDHADVTEQEKYLPIVRAKTDAGVVCRSDYATLYDRIRMSRGLPQMYASQTVALTHRNGKSTCYLWPLENASLVDSLRKQMEMTPLKRYLKLVRKTYGQTVVWDKNLSVERLSVMKMDEYW